MGRGSPRERQASSRGEPREGDPRPFDGTAARAAADSAGIPDAAPTPPPLAVALPSIGIFLKTMRESLGMTQEQLAARTEGLGWPVSRTTISALEKGKHSPSAVTVMAITTILHVDPMEIFDRFKMATPLPVEYRSWSVEQLDARSKELFEARKFRETLTILDVLMARLVDPAPADPDGTPRRMAVMEVRRATTLRRLGALSAAKSAAERAVALSPEFPDLTAQAYMVLVAVHLRSGNVQLGADLAERAVQLAASGGPGLLGQALLSRGRALADNGRFEEAYAVFLDAREHVSKAGDGLHALLATGNMGLCLSRLGKRSEAEARIRSSVELARKLRRPDLEARWLVEWGRIALAAGRVGEAKHLGGLALGIAQRGEYWPVAFSATMLLHRIAKAQDPGTADRHRIAYLKKLSSWVEEDVSDPDYQEFLAETLRGPNTREREA